MAPVLIFMGVWVTVMVVVFIGGERGLRRSGFVSSRPVPQEAAITRSIRQLLA